MGEELEAIIEHDGDEKYIIAHVGENGSMKKVLVSLPCEYHSGIAREYKGRQNGNADSVCIEGGGILTIDRQAKKIHTYGTSGGFGRPDIDEVRKILKHEFPEYEIDATVTSYIRG
ncbi:MAG: hypothetical protein KKF46_07825 [Nanoarchaeota archaeon]|nr:hypothetical protein [Nanoarchaeota archaeon]MBU1598045.1 hypothetical protein [Nanoarchaeota archaeon]MBU2442050.1 hypothetical protein [Nanoarchaeota archaeon]